MDDASGRLRAVDDAFGRLRAVRTIADRTPPLPLLRALLLAPPETGRRGQGSDGCRRGWDRRAEGRDRGGSWRRRRCRRAIADRTPPLPLLLRALLLAPPETGRRGQWRSQKCSAGRAPSSSSTFSPSFPLLPSQNSRGGLGGALMASPAVGGASAPPDPALAPPRRRHPCLRARFRFLIPLLPDPARIEGSGDMRREAKAKARVRSRRMGENAFYRRKRRAAAAAASGQADTFTDAELEMIGMGYDRAVRFMDGPDDPRLRHPHDWYKYGRYGPYHWRGIVVGPPIRGRFSDDRVSLMEEVHDHEEWDKIEQFDMCNQFSHRLNELGDGVPLRFYWVFVRHPKWRPNEKPGEQWTLSAEVAVQAGKEERLDKWSLMGRFGNPTRELITRCAAWTRPDIIYVKRPLYQSRFEPQEDFFKKLRPLVDPATEGNFLFDLELDGQVIRTTYFGALCRIVKANPKAYVDDVVNAYSRLSEADQSRCLEFLLTNHPMELLHPYTKEWKVKLEEMELGCDAPDESDDDIGDDDEMDIVDWVKDDEADDVADGGYSDYEVEDVVDTNDAVDGDYQDEDVVDTNEDLGADEIVENSEDSEKYWDQQWKKALRSSDKMEKLVKTSIEASNERMEQQMELEKEMEWKMDRANAMVMEQEQTEEDEEEQESTRSRSAEDGRQRDANAGLFLRAAVRPFTYRNLVKEIVLLRHHIIDGEIV